MVTIQSKECLHYYCGVGLARTMYIRCTYGTYCREKSPNIPSYTVCMYGSGQSYCGACTGEGMVRQLQQYVSTANTFPFCSHLFLRIFQQPNPFCCNRSTTSLFMISFLSRTITFYFFFLSLWNYLWLAETSQQPISQTTWLKVTPHCNHCNHSLCGAPQAAGQKIATFLNPCRKHLFPNKSSLPRSLRYSPHYPLGSKV